MATDQGLAEQEAIEKAAATYARTQQVIGDLKAEVERMTIDLAHCRAREEQLNLSIAEERARCRELQTERDAAVEQRAQYHVMFHNMRLMIDKFVAPLPELPRRPSLATELLEAIYAANGYTLNDAKAVNEAISRVISKDSLLEARAEIANDIMKGTRDAAGNVLVKEDTALVREGDTTQVVELPNPLKSRSTVPADDFMASDIPVEDVDHRLVPRR